MRSVTAVVPIPRCYFAMPEYNCLCTRRALFEITLGNRTALPPDTPPSVQVSRSLRAPGVYKPGAHTFAERPLATNRLPHLRRFAILPLLLLRFSEPLAIAARCGAHLTKPQAGPVKWRIGIFCTATAGCLIPAISRLWPPTRCTQIPQLVGPKLSGVDRTGATQ